MNATTVPSQPQPPLAKTSRLDDLIPLFGGGFVLAAVAIFGCAIINALAFAFFEYFFGGEDTGTLPPVAVIGAGVFAIIVSVVVGRWLFNLRRWIGKKGDPADDDIVHRKQRSFTIGAMGLYLPLSPAVWVLFVAIANSAA
jgi:hypothetical protein